MYQYLTRKRGLIKVRAGWLRRIACMLLVVGAALFMPTDASAYHYENKQFGFSMELPMKPTFREVSGAPLMVFPTGQSWGLIITEQKQHEQLLKMSPDEIRDMENESRTDLRQLCELVDIDRSGKYPVMLMVGRYSSNYSYLITAFTGDMMYGFGRVTTAPMHPAELGALLESVKSLRLLPKMKGIKR
ncbi:MAG: hypothetical protein J6B02_01015 [Selenomonadales bacterium]|nr:hypothetical protein [Selenomonadales bacterium]